MYLSCNEHHDVNTFGRTYQIMFLSTFETNQTTELLRSVMENVLND